MSEGGLTYFAHPIDQVEMPSHLVVVATTAAARAGIALYRPGTAFATFDLPGLGESLAIDQINRRALHACDSLLAVLPAGVPTLGVPVEIERALQAGKPTVIVTDESMLCNSVQVASWIAAGAHAYAADTLPQGAELAALLRPGHDLPSTMQWATVGQNSATEPNRTYPDDAGFDLAASFPTTVHPRESALIPTGVRFALPAGHWGLILGRSSTWHKRGLLTVPGVIDAGWRGELFVSVYNMHPHERQVIEPGERLGQFIVLPAWLGQLQRVDELPEHERGLNGFGSSGS